MFDILRIRDSLTNIEASLHDLLEWTARLTSSDDFTLSGDGMILLNAVCMKLFVVGEEVKNIDKYSGKALLPQYSSVEWNEIMRMRDKIGHHYFEIDADLVYAIIRNDIPSLLDVILQVKKDIEKQITQKMIDNWS
jgi:uncharacterized protein with HEPN domain